MCKARFTEQQIIAVLKSVKAGRTVKDVCREAGISEASYYNWKAKYGGMEASDIKKMKDLEDENRRLKQMFADLSLLNPWRFKHYSSRFLLFLINGFWYQMYFS